MSRTETPIDEGCDTRDMLLVHRVYKREFALLPRMIRAVPAGDVERAKLIAAHATEMLDSLHHHHHGEDALLWPKLNARVQLEHALVRRMEEQHARVGEHIGNATTMLPAWAGSADLKRGTQLADTLERMSGLLVEHLDEEEQHVLPLVAVHVTQTEWAELADRGMAAMPKPRLLVFLGYMLEDSTADERARFMAHVPVPARVAYKLVGRRKHLAESTRLRSQLA